jgi:hypothetical protein
MSVSLALVFSFMFEELIAFKLQGFMAFSFVLDSIFSK